MTADGNLVFGNLLPGGNAGAVGAMPINPFTQAVTTLDWGIAAGTAPLTDAAGGIALNVWQSAGAGAFDSYDVLGEDDAGAVLSLVLTNQ